MLWTFSQPCTLYFTLLDIWAVSSHHGGNINHFLSLIDLTLFFLFLHLKWCEHYMFLHLSFKRQIKTRSKSACIKLWTFWRKVLHGIKRIHKHSLVCKADVERKRVKVQFSFKVSPRACNAAESLHQIKYDGLGFHQ